FRYRFYYSPKCELRHMPPRVRIGRHPTGSRALTQSGEYFQADIPINRVHADLFLIGQDGADGVAACAAVNAVGLETQLVETALTLLDLIQGQHAFAAGKLLPEWRITADQVAKMA